MGGKNKNGGLVVLHHSLTRDPNKHLWCQFSCSPPHPAGNCPWVYFTFYLRHFIFTGWFAHFTFITLRAPAASRRLKLGSNHGSLVWQSPFPLQVFPGTCCPLLSPPCIVLTPPPSAANRGCPSALSYSKNPQKMRVGDDLRRCFRVKAVFQWLHS